MTEPAPSQDASRKPRSDGPGCDPKSPGSTEKSVLTSTSTSLSALAPSAAADRFRSLYRQGHQPDVDSFLAQEPELPLSDLAAVLRIDQQERLARGEFITAETYLARYPRFQRHRETAVDLIYGEFLLREDYDEQPDPAEYLRRFPEHADVLGPQIELHLAMRASTSGIGSSLKQDGEWKHLDSALTTCAGVLDALKDTLGSVRRIQLKEADTEAVPTKREPAEDAGRLEILNEVARGGMGIILRGATGIWAGNSLSRFSGNRTDEIRRLRRRFIEEAQIGGQLQHPGIVPVYEMGLLFDRRPYFSMQLIRGRTLAELLAERGASHEDLPRFLDVFERVAQTVAYAHSRGVIHRDLKPANIMVGRFGEVQVMDWGLAKVLGSSSGDEAGVRVVSTHDLASTASLSGSVIGTPAYMAPEQARGEVLRIDERVDVFALGALLCEILTGSPPYQGHSTAEILQEATQAAASSAIDRISSPHHRSGAENSGRTLSGLGAERTAPGCERCRSLHHRLFGGRSAQASTNGAGAR